MDASEIIARAGGATALAARLGLDRSSVSKWLARNRIPVERVPAVEAATGIPRHVLRSDLWEAPGPEVS
jgi:DNA-binding transcriptional regulator YdaS (Cro superfamily)